MKFIIRSLLMLIPGVLAAQTWTPCGSSTTPCVINAQLSGSPCQITFGSQYQYVEVSPGVQVQWNITGASFFFIGFESTSTVFGTNPFFVSLDGTSASGTASVPSKTSHYYIYALTSTGQKCFLDPKIRTTSGPLDGRRKK
jgi:hypothetical protein